MGKYFCKTNFWRKKIKKVVKKTMNRKCYDATSYDLHNNQDRYYAFFKNKI